MSTLYGQKFRKPRVWTPRENKEYDCVNSKN